MSGMQIETPLPETVHLCDENFLYKIAMAQPDDELLARRFSGAVLPLLAAGTFE